MPKSLEGEDRGRYFTWILFMRAGVWYADGRSNQPSPGRHSLSTKERTAAVDAVRKLDIVRAVDLGLADLTMLDPEASAALTLEAGWTSTAVMSPGLVSPVAPSRVGNGTGQYSTSSIRFAAGTA